ncbi:Ran-binding zinc finger domain-containing protein [Streptacidiphilus sp. MAP5-52]|uniref:zinc finger Ran-binding domain-containing protein n=1 Tax=Streptacidiphilus sp. MAP5-52 TaxID=3156267 RepID=UPI0035128815
MSETNETIIPATAVATALQELFATYPTDPEGTATAVVLTVTDPATGAQHTIELQPGQASWLTGLTMDEVATCRNAHSDGNGECGHCGGSGKAGHLDDPDPYLGEDGLIYHGDGEVDVEASAEMLAQEEPDPAAPGTWQCAECETYNGREDLDCMVCGTLRPGE